MMFLAYIRYTVLGLALLFAQPSAAEMRIVTGEEPPTNYLENDEVVGTTVDIVNALKDIMGDSTIIEFMPWARAMYIAERQSHVMIFTAGRTEARIDHGFQFVGPVVTRKHQLWKLKSRDLVINTDQDILDREYVIGGVREDWRSKKYKALNAKVALTRDHAQNLQKLIRGRIDLWISSDIEAPVISRKVEVDISLIEPVYTIKEAPSYLMFSKTTPEYVVKAWEDAFDKLYETDFFEKTSSKWSKELKYPVSFSKDKGYFIDQ